MEGKIKVINLGFVNCYLITVDGGFILVDTGGSTVFDTNLPRIRAKLVSELESAGCTPGKLKLAVITHGDIDHNGNGAFLKEQYGVKIAIHKEDAGQVDIIKQPEMRMRKKSILSGFFMLLLKPALKKMQDQYIPYQPDFQIDESFDLKAYGWDAKILHLPGHTRGSIGILTAGGDFFCGDIYNNGGKPVLTTLGVDFDALDASAERIKKLPLKMVYPGHGKPFLMELLSEK